MKSTKYARGLCAVAAAVCAALAQSASATVSLNSGTYLITHDIDTGAATSNKTASGNIPASGSMPTPSSYEYGLKTITLGTGSSSASGSVGAITNSSIVGFTFASGTGVSQTDNGNTLIGAAQLRFVVDATWDVNSGGFGTTANGYLGFTLGGVVPAGDSVQLVANLRWFNPATNADYRTPLSTTVNIPSSTLPYSFLNQATLNGGSITSGKQIRCTGTIDFRATDPGATANLTPLNFEMSAAPPTFDFTAGGAQDYTDPTKWASANTDDATSQPIAPFPNAPGVRAHFAGTNAAKQFGNPDSATTTLNQSITLGTVDLDEQDRNFNGSGNLTFANEATNANDCVIFARNTHDYFPTSSGHDFAIPVILTRNLDIINEAAGPIRFLAPISEVGSPHTLIKSGTGPLVFLAPNTFTGGIVINGGMVSTAGSGNWGTGQVTVASNSQAAFDAGAGSAIFNVQDLGCISGSPADLSALTVGTSLILPGGGGHAVIGHQKFDTGASGNPSLLVPTPQIFGISADFSSAGGGESIVVGGLAPGLWTGFGGDTQSHVFGAPGGGSQNLTYSGIGQLVALGGQLTVNAPIHGGIASTINKLGQGLVSIEHASNDFAGAMNVNAGAVALDGTWNSNGTVGSAVNVASGAALGGTGNVKSQLNFLSGSHFEPGTITALPGAANQGAIVPTTLQGPGTLHVLQNVIFNAGSQLDYDLDDASPGTPNDLLTVVGSIQLNGTLNIHDFDFDQDGLGVSPNAVYALMTYTSGATGALTLNPQFLSDFPSAQIIVTNPSGAGFVLLAVPEPSTIGLLAVGAMGLLSRRKRYVRA